MVVNKLKQLDGSPGCILCDNSGENTRSLALKIFWDTTKNSIHIPCVPDVSWCGYHGVVHGGIVASLLDEAMAWAVKQKLGEWAFTADFHVRYKAPMYSGQEYETVGEVIGIGRKITTSAYIFHRESNDIISKAEATFLLQK